MSANNIVVIKKEDDGKVRGYHRDYDAYCEGQYDYDGPCQFCLDGCDMCNYTKHYTSPKENPIFVADTIEGAILAYDKWCQETMFAVEYGYIFENLEPNEETIKAMEECDREEALHKVDSVEELVEELNGPMDTELLEFIQNQGKKPGDKCWCYECPGQFDMVGEPRIDCQVCNGSGIIPEEWFRREFEKEKTKTDTELLDFLQLLTDNARYTGKVICRASTTGRGWRLLETSWDGAVSDVREAITNYMKWVLKGEKST